MLTAKARHALSQIVLGSLAALAEVVRAGQDACFKFCVAPCTCLSERTSFAPAIRGCIGARAVGMQWSKSLSLLRIKSRSLHRSESFASPGSRIYIVPTRLQRDGCVKPAMRSHKLCLAHWRPWPKPASSSALHTIALHRARACRSGWSKKCLKPVVNLHLSICIGTKLLC